MARRRASMREGPLAELFRATEAAQKQAERPIEEGGTAPEDAEGAAAPATPEPDERTVEHVPSWEEEVAAEPATAPPRERPRAPEPAPAARYLEPLPESPPRLHRSPSAEGGAYLAVI